MGILAKDFSTTFLPGKAGQAAVAGTPATPGFYVTTTTNIYDTEYVPPLDRFGLTIKTVDSVRGEDGIKIATFDEVATIPALTAAAADVKEGRDPTEKVWMVTVKQLIDQERNSGVLGRALKVLPKEPGALYSPYLAVWSTLTGQGCGIFRFDGFSNSSRPTLTINSKDPRL